MKYDILKAIKASKGVMKVIVVCVVICIAIIFWPESKEKPPKVDLLETSSIDTICELATLKSYYHNVVVCEENPSDGLKKASTVFLWPFDKKAKTGYKQFWMEYSGIVTTGIDQSEVQVIPHYDEGIIEVYIPDAKVLSVDADEDSLSEPLTEKGLFTSITAEEQADAFAQAQSEMRRKAENDQALLRRARNNAKRLLEQYIKKTCEIIGVDYSIKWIDSPI